MTSSKTISLWLSYLFGIGFFGLVMFAILKFAPVG